jgi:hypothetical protein
VSLSPLAILLPNPRSKPPCPYCPNRRWEACVRGLITLKVLHDFLASVSRSRPSLALSCLNDILVCYCCQYACPRMRRGRRRLTSLLWVRGPRRRQGTSDAPLDAPVFDRLARLAQTTTPTPASDLTTNQLHSARSAFAYNLFLSFSPSARQRLAQNEPDPSPRASRPLAASLTEQVALWCGRQPRRPLCQCLACQHRRRRRWRRWQGHVCCSGQVSRRYSRLRRREVGKRAQSNS